MANKVTSGLWTNKLILLQYHYVIKKYDSIAKVKKIEECNQQSTS